MAHDASPLSIKILCYSLSFPVMSVCCKSHLLFFFVSSSSAMVICVVFTVFLSPFSPTLSSSFNICTPPSLGTSQSQQYQFYPLVHSYVSIIGLCLAIIVQTSIIIMSFCKPYMQSSITRCSYSFIVFIISLPLSNTIPTSSILSI